MPKVSKLHNCVQYLFNFLKNLNFISKKLKWGSASNNLTFFFFILFTFGSAGSSLLLRFFSSCGAQASLVAEHGP